MKPLLSRSVSALSLALLDLVVVGRLLGGTVERSDVLLSLVAHACIACAAGLLLRDVMPPFVRATRSEVTVFVALVAAFVPIVGIAGLAGALMFGLSEFRDARAEPWQVLEPVSRDDEQPPRQRRAISAAEVSAALRQRTSQAAEFRMQAVLSIRQLPPRIGVALLKMAQSDPSDEVRLYAFSRLERMRDDLEKQIKQMSSSLETIEERDKARINLRLAECYWELAYLGLAEGAVLEHALKSAHRHAAIACELRPQHAAAEFFLGRILIFMREAERAAVAFQRAIAAGYPRVKVLPYLAECAFYRRDFRSVRHLLRELDGSSPENIFFRPVMRFWHEHASGEMSITRGSRRSIRMKAVRPS